MVPFPRRPDALTTAVAEAAVAAGTTVTATVLTTENAAIAAENTATALQSLREVLWLLVLLRNKLLLLQMLTASSIPLTATYIPVPTSAAIVAFTSPASPYLNAPGLKTSDQGMAVCPVRLLLGLFHLDEGSLQFIQRQLIFYN